MKAVTLVVAEAAAVNRQDISRRKSTVRDTPDGRRNRPADAQTKQHGMRKMRPIERVVSINNCFTAPASAFPIDAAFHKRRHSIA